MIHLYDRQLFSFIIVENCILAHFTLETSAIIETLPIESLQIRAITVISNTLNEFRSIYSLDNSPLLNLILNPLLSEQFPSELSTVKFIYKGYVSKTLLFDYSLIYTSFSTFYSCYLVQFDHSFAQKAHLCPCNFSFLPESLSKN